MATRKGFYIAAVLLLLFQPEVAYGVGSCGCAHDPPIGFSDLNSAASAIASQPGQTRVSLKLVSPNAIPMVGGELDRFGVRGLAQQMVDETLRALREWCESEDGPSA